MSIFFRLLLRAVDLKAVPHVEEVAAAVYAFACIFGIAAAAAGSVASRYVRDGLTTAFGCCCLEILSNPSFRRLHPNVEGRTLSFLWQHYFRPRPSLIRMEKEAMFGFDVDG